ncbi:MAG TPA: nucleoside recognition domain-containing protein, partial [Desulfuromonadales bacterium]|nr:nucleoside recognition domain-containing protein [Desulfuromonadales bacterium]
MSGLRSASRKVLKDAVATSLPLYKIIIPISLVTKLLTEFGLTERLGAGLAPVMEVVGLPGSMGLVWATAMVTNLYGGMVVFASLAPDAALSVAQVTVLTTMMLVAHALPVELR